MNGGGDDDERWSDATDLLPPSSPLRPPDEFSSVAASSSTPPSMMPLEPPIVEEPPKPNSPSPETPKPDTSGACGLPPSSTSNSSSSASSDDDADDGPSRKKQRPLSSFAPSTSPAGPTAAEPSPPAPIAAIPSNKKPKKKGNSLWTKSTSRKSKKKGKVGNNNHHHHHPAVAPAVEDKVLLAPVPRFPDKTDDSPDAKICLSKVYKAEKVELSEDRLTAGSTKGYRMVRATRGVLEGAWYFEIRIVRLGETGHTRLGWTTEKGDLQAPVGYDGNSYGYRDIDGVKVHKALREKYGEEGYTEGDVIGFYINLPDGAKYAPKPPHLVWYKGQRYVSLTDAKVDPPKVVPGSEISFFKNGVCQGIAFADLFGGRYYPAASMYTLPNQSNCEVKFNFGPDFEFFPQDFGGRPAPLPMIELPYHSYDGGSNVEGPPGNGSAENTTT